MNNWEKIDEEKDWRVELSFINIFLINVIPFKTLMQKKKAKNNTFPSVKGLPRKKKNAHKLLF